LDGSCAKSLGAALKRLIATGERECIVDLSAVEAVDSAGFGALIAALRKIEQAGARAVVVCPNPAVRRLFEIADISAFMPVVENLTQARMLVRRFASSLAS
jgi:anti-anti-sigma factor